MGNFIFLFYLFLFNVYIFMIIHNKVYYIFVEIVYGIHVVQLNLILIVDVIVQILSMI